MRVFFLALLVPCLVAGAATGTPEPAATQDKVDPYETAYEILGQVRETVDGMRTRVDSKIKTIGTLVDALELQQLLSFAIYGDMRNKLLRSQIMALEAQSARIEEKLREIDEAATA
ncbi:MAG: hypothetical protein MHM6MM_006760 [Cercozoa sp. M6MM]